MDHVGQLVLFRTSGGPAHLVFVNPRTKRFHKLDRIHSECHLGVVARGGAGYFLDSERAAVAMGLRPCGRCVLPLSEAA